MKINGQVKKALTWLLYKKLLNFYQRKKYSEYTVSQISI